MIFVDEEDEVTIHLTRGDKVENLCVCYPVQEENEVKNYIFKVGDKLSFIVKEKKGYTEEEVFRKDFIIDEETEYAPIRLSSEETKWGDIRNKKIVFWYDIVLNDNVTILGYDDDGAKRIYLYPEGGEDGSSKG